MTCKLRVFKLKKAMRMLYMLCTIMHVISNISNIFTHIMLKLMVSKKLYNSDHLCQKTS